MEKKVDYIIVGQGLAGSILSFVLLQSGKSVMVFDDEEIDTSSSVAAGLYNPITGRKMVKTWNADHLFPSIEPFYREMEMVTRSRFLNPIPIYRPFVNPAEENEWQLKSQETAYRPYISEVTGQSRYEAVEDPFGGIVVNHSGFVKIPGLMKAMGAYLKARGSLIREKFNRDEMLLSEQTVTYGGIKASKVVFCTGILNDPSFNFLPFRPVKGEILEISANLNINHVINRGVFVIPLENGNFRLGSTYNWKDLTTRVTREGRNILEEKFGKLMNISMEIVGEKAGIRPATVDRRPFIGLHPELPQLGIFNGFGTKGVSLAPYYARQFVRWLEFGEQLDSEVNIERYFSLS